LENAKKNLVFHFGVGRNAPFPQKPSVKYLSAKLEIHVFYDQKLPTTQETLQKLETCIKVSVWPKFNGNVAKKNNLYQILREKKNQKWETTSRILHAKKVAKNLNLYKSFSLAQFFRKKLQI
jgi:hypothetical protein